MAYDFCAECAKEVAPLIQDLTKLNDRLIETNQRADHWEAIAKKAEVVIMKLQSHVTDLGDKLRAYEEGAMEATSPVKHLPSSESSEGVSENEAGGKNE